MSILSNIDEGLRANLEYARRFDQGSLSMPPARKLAILACMDARLTVESILGLKTGDAHIIRNAGGIATDDAIRSLIISHTLLGTQEFMVINHTDCGMLTFKDSDLKSKLIKETRMAASSPDAFLAFDDVKDNIREQMLKIRSHPWIPKGIPVRGFLYDVKTGKLSEVE